MRLSYKALALGVVIAVGVSACSGDSHLAQAPGEARNGSAAATATRGGELNALTARGVVDALHRAGFAAANPVDTTAQECPDAGCDQSIVTDTLQVKSFSTTGRAQKYAATQGLFQVGTVVVEFAPSVPQSERERYRAQLQRVVG